MQRYHKQVLYILIGLSIVTIAYALLAPPKLHFSFANKIACAPSLKLFPQTIKPTETHGDFSLQRPASLSVGGVAIFSRQVCVSPQHYPKPDTDYVKKESIFGNMQIGRPIKIRTTSSPKLSADDKIHQPIPIDRPIKFHLDKPDGTSTYSVAIGDLAPTSCHTDKLSVLCDVSALQLKHGEIYTMKVHRVFKNSESVAIFQQNIQTLTPVRIVEHSISPNSIVYDKPQHITLKTDKLLKEIGKILLVAKNGTDEKNIAITHTSTDTSITVSLEKPLDRKTNYELRIAALRATDDSSLTEPYSLPFTTSGGPIVTGINIPKQNVARNQRMTLTFDQDIAKDQDFSSLIKLEASDKNHPIRFAAAGNRLTATPIGELPLCARFTITISPEISNPYGISGDAQWSMQSRASCHTTFTIGTSVQGRPITAHRYGTGGSTILYIGALHGNEFSSKTVLDNWLDELNGNSDNLPERSLVVIPLANPDGFANKSRLNARGVDLNRNFPARDWKSAVSLPGGAQTSAGGGAAPLSEPESQALANFIRNERPRLILSYHAAATLVEANEAGDSVLLGSIYASKSRYRAIPKSQSSVFTYDTTGALEDWAREQLNIPVLVIELVRSSGNEFPRNRDAMWHMAKL